MLKFICSCVIAPRVLPVELTLPALTGILSITESESKPVTVFHYDFVMLHQKHLLSMYPRSSKGTYDKICVMVVLKYKEYSDAGMQGNPNDEEQPTWDFIKVYLKHNPF